MAISSTCQYKDLKHRYGAVKICNILHDNGIPCSVKRVPRHMAKQGLRSVVVKKYNHHTSHGSIPDDKVNILNRDFEAKTINQKWGTDITYIHVEKEGEKFELRSKLFDHAAHNGSNYLNGHCMVSILLSFPVFADGAIRYLSVPLGYQLWDKKQTKLEIAAGMVRCAMNKIDPDRQVFLLCDS